jgi:hypothetical protein
MENYIGEKILLASRADSIIFHSLLITDER